MDFLFFPKDAKSFFELNHALYMTPRTPVDAVVSLQDAFEQRQERECPPVSVLHANGRHAHHGTLHTQMVWSSRGMETLENESCYHFGSETWRAPLVCIR